MDDERPAIPGTCDGDLPASIRALGRRFDNGGPAVLRVRPVPDGAPRPVLDGDRPPAAGPIVVVCGSCSPVSVGQIRTAIEGGFAEVILSPNALAAGEINSAVASAVAMVSLALDGGRSVVLHTHCDHRVDHTPADDAHLGEALGRVLKRTLERRPVRRVVVVGGETCGHVAETLGIDSLRILAALCDGLYECRAAAGTASVDGVAMVLKGGDVGGDDVFVRVRDG